MAATRSNALALYKRLLREGQKFSGYNNRMYAMRRIRDAFRESRSETDASKVQDLLAKGEQTCEVLRRQVVISQLYKEPILVIEAAQRNQSS